LSSIKTDDEDIHIEGFYDSVEGPSRAVSRTIRQHTLDEQGRLRAWKMPQFLFGMSGAPLTSAETTLPTCNVSALTVEAMNEIGNIPTAASASMDFQLVPHQIPKDIGVLLRDHLESKGYSDVSLDLLPGGYPAAATDPDHAFIQHIAATGTQVYNAPLTCLPFGPFAVPLSLLRREPSAPVAALGCLRPDSAARAANEHAPLPDLLRHGQILIELLWSLVGAAEAI
jgi:acetylornithine deacetylase/succinyl-diaminopimelate desuccinylase-like protein